MIKETEFIRVRVSKKLKARIIKEVKKQKTDVSKFVRQAIIHELYDTEEEEILEPYDYR